jgi:guanyl-specific ribonuclease Sa
MKRDGSRKITGRKMAAEPGRVYFSARHFSASRFPIEESRKITGRKMAAEPGRVYFSARHFSAS